MVGSIQPDNTVKGGTGWGAEFAKICNKPLLVFDQEQDAWFRWSNDAWVREEEPVIQRTHFTATGTRFLEPNGRKAHCRSVRPFLQPLDWRSAAFSRNLPCPGRDAARLPCFGSHPVQDGFFTISPSGSFPFAREEEGVLIWGMEACLFS